MTQSLTYQTQRLLSVLLVPSLLSISFLAGRLLQYPISPLQFTFWSKFIKIF